MAEHQKTFLFSRFLFEEFGFLISLRKLIVSTLISIDLLWLISIWVYLSVVVKYTKGKSNYRSQVSIHLNSGYFSRMFYLQEHFSVLSLAHAHTHHTHTQTHINTRIHIHKRTQASMNRGRHLCRHINLYLQIYITWQSLSFIFFLLTITIHILDLPKPLHVLRFFNLSLLLVYSIFMTYWNNRFPSDKSKLNWNEPDQYLNGGQFCKISYGSQFLSKINRACYNNLSSFHFLLAKMSVFLLSN